MIAEGQRRGRHERQAPLTIVGALMLLMLWEVIGRQHVLGSAFPPLSAVLVYGLDHLQLLDRALLATSTAALCGFICGAIAGLATASIGYLVNGLRISLDRFAATLYAIPTIALGPIFSLLFDARIVPAAVSALGVYFVVHLGASAALAGIAPRHEDLAAAFGATRMRRLAYLDIPALLPAILNSLKAGVPLAVIGAILGEWFGSERGLGVLIVTAMRNFTINLLWSSVLLAACLSLAAYSTLAALDSWLQARRS